MAASHSMSVHVHPWSPGSHSEALSPSSILQESFHRVPGVPDASGRLPARRKDRGRPYPEDSVFHFNSLYITSVDS